MVGPERSPIIIGFAIRNCAQDESEILGGKEDPPILARQRRPRLRLDPEVYAALRQRVLQHDGWRCQKCGSLQNLEVHHVQSRSKLGDDAEENLITLCNRCHRSLHSTVSWL